MFRFLQACYWTFFCRREKPDTVPSKIHPYRIIPKGWCVRREKPDDEVYNVSQVFLLNEDLLACAAVESDDHYQLPQFWLLKGSRLVINHVGDQMVTVVTRVFDGVPFFITFDKLAEMTRLNDCP